MARVRFEHPTENSWVEGEFTPPNIMWVDLIGRDNLCHPIPPSGYHTDKQTWNVTHHPNKPGRLTHWLFLPEKSKPKAFHIQKIPQRGF